jgi:hypothetical protein
VELGELAELLHLGPSVLLLVELVELEVALDQEVILSLGQVEPGAQRLVEPST